MISIWYTLIYEPIYNALIFIVELLPGHSVGVAIIILTLLVKILLYPLTTRSIKAQRAMKELEPELKVIKEKYSDDREKLARNTMELYKKRGVSPFSGCLPLLIQIPVIIGLYLVFFSGLKEIDTTILYSFVVAPALLDMKFLMFDLSAKSIILALLAGVTQYYQTSLSLGKPKKEEVSAKKPGESSFQEDFTRSMQIQMRYVLPVMVGFIAYTTAAAVALYWATSNILGIVQEYLVKREKPTQTP